MDIPEDGLLKIIVKKKSFFFYFILLFYLLKKRLPTNPQVGKYDIAEKIGNLKVKWSIFPKGRIFNDNHDKYLPAPNHY